MTNPNPYQASTEADLPKQTTIARSRLSGGMILLLAPVASYVAFFVSCSAVYLLYNAILLLDQSLRTVVAGTILIGPPVASAFAMIWWAAHTRRHGTRH